MSKKYFPNSIFFPERSAKNMLKSKISEFYRLLLILNRHAQTWNLGGLVVPLVKVLPVEIGSWNLAHRLRRPKEALGKFFGSGSFLVTSQWGSKETLWSLGSERLERDGTLKLCRELPWFISGPRNFIQHDWSIGWASNLIFLAQVWNLQISFY